MGTVRRSQRLASLSKVSSILVLLVLVCPRGGHAGTLAEVHLESLQEAEELDLQVLEIPGSETVFLDLDALDERHQVARGDLGPYRAYYNYDETTLYPDSSTASYLSLFVLDERDAVQHSSDAYPVDSFRYRLAVDGDFVDRHVQVPLTISRGDVAASGHLRITVHQADPRNVISHEGETELLLDVRTKSREYHPIVFNNHGCCSVHLIEHSIAGRNEDLWDELAIEPGPPLSGGQAQNWLSLVTEPKSSVAFWETALAPFSDDKPHERFRIVTHFQVEGGQSAYLHVPVRVRFRPGLLSLVCCVAAGAILSGGLRLAHVGRKDPRQLWGDARGFWGKLGSLLTRVLVAIAASILIFFLFTWIKGEKEVVLFDLSLDPTQLLPAFIIGLVAGYRPDFYFDRLSKILPREGGATAGLFVLFVLVGAPPVGGQEFAVEEHLRDLGRFRPAALAYDWSDDAMYVLDSSVHKVFRVDREKERLEPLVDLGHSNDASSDLCFYSENGSRFLVAASLRRIGSIWRSALTVVDLETGATRRQLFPFLQISGLTCDGARGRVLFSENLRHSVYSVDFSDLVVAAADPQWFSSLVGSSGALVVWGDTLFQGQEEHLTMKDLASSAETETGRIRVGRGPYTDIAAIAPNPIDGTILVAEASRGRILEVWPDSGSLEVRLEHGDLGTPRAVQIDQRGALWVADVSTRSVLRFSTDDRSPVVYSSAQRKN